MPTNDINFDTIYEMYFGKPYDPTVFIKDISVTEYISINEETGTQVGLGHIQCTDNCEMSNISMDDSTIESSKIDVSIYQNVVFMKFPPHKTDGNNLILKYNSTVQADGNPNVGNIRCEGGNKFNFEFSLAGMFIITPPAHAFYIENGSNPDFTMANTSIKASSILIYQSVCDPKIYIGVIVNLEDGGDDYQPGNVLNECLYQSLLEGIQNNTKISTKNVNQNTPLNKNKLTLDDIIKKSESNTCGTEFTSLSLKDLMPEDKENFFTWLDPTHQEKLFWICYEDTIKLKTDTLRKFHESISEKNYWNNSFNCLVKRSCSMTKSINFTYEPTSNPLLNPNLTNSVSISAKINGSNLTVDNYSENQNLKNNQNGSMEDICATGVGGTTPDDSVVVVNALGANGDKTFLVEVDKNGNNMTGSGNNVSQDVMTNLVKTVGDLKKSIENKEDTRLPMKALFDAHQGATQPKSTISPVTKGFIWFLGIYLALTIFATFIFIYWPKLYIKPFRIFFPIINYIIGEKAVIDIKTQNIATDVTRRLTDPMREVTSMKQNLAKLLTPDDKNAQIKELKEKAEAQAQELEQAQTQAQTQAHAQTQAPSQETTTTPEENTLNTDQLRQELEDNPSLSGGYRKNKKIKRKAKVGYKRFRKSQL
jgi:hypothetical protein